MSPYNLLAERWIPVRRASGSLDWIAPWQIAEMDDPPLRIESPRPDFDGALIQFLIGLVQTVAAPESKLAWRRGFDRPPENLREVFESVAQAFNLDGEGPRFMQDLTLKRSDVKGILPISALLISEPTEFFVKPGLIGGLSYAMAAAALYTLQTNAPSGGRGHLTSLRGGGPLTTVLVGDTLWRTVWLNGLIHGDFLAGPGNPERNALADKFPWMASTRTTKATLPDDVHPCQHYWGMPRRIRLDFVDSRLGRCDLSGTKNSPLVSQYLAKHHGTNYGGGAWSHPLTPYTLQPGKAPNARKGQADGLPYREWPQLVLAGSERVRARVVAAYENERRFDQQSSPRLWAFGFDFVPGQMKPRCWYSGITPILPLAEEGQQRAYAGRIQQCIDASEAVRKTLIQQIKAALLRRPQDGKGDLSFISRQFWSATETEFFDVAREIHDAIVDDAKDIDAREQWLKHLHRTALEVFTANSQEAGEFADADVKRIAVAWNNLVQFTSPRGKKLRGMVALPTISQTREHGGTNV